MTRAAAATLNALVEATRDSLDFYTDAAARVRNPQIKILFRALLDAKQQLLSALGEEVRVRGELPSRDESFGGGLRKLYANLRARLADRGDLADIADLEQSEDRLLSAFEQAADDAEEPDLRRAILAYVPRLRRCHDQMRNLKVSLG